PDFLMKLLPKGSIIPPGDTIRFMIYLTPLSLGVQTGSIRIVAHTVNNPADSSAGVITLTADVSSGRGILEIPQPAINFSTRTICDGDDSVSILLKNTGCDT